MSLVPFGEEIYDAIVDVNNGKHTESFRQGDDSEYDVDITPTSNLDTGESPTISVTNSESGYSNDTKVYIHNINSVPKNCDGYIEVQYSNFGGSPNSNSIELVVDNITVDSFSTGSSTKSSGTLTHSYTEDGSGIVVYVHIEGGADDSIDYDVTINKEVTIPINVTEDFYVDSITKV